MTVDICPECGSTQIANVVGHPESPTDSDAGFRCTACSVHFDEPEERESRRDSTVTSPLARKLEKADPSDVGEFSANVSESGHDGRGEDQTSMREMREMARDNGQFKRPVETLIQTKALEQFPFRDYDKLTRVVENADRPSDVVKHFDCTYQAIQRWCRAYGIPYPDPGHCTIGESLANASPEQLGDD